MTTSSSSTSPSKGRSKSEYKRRIIASLRGKGVDGEIKARVRAHIIGDIRLKVRSARRKAQNLLLKDDKISDDEKPLADRLVGSMFAEFLCSRKFGYTEAVFLPEAGLGSKSSLLTPREMREALRFDDGKEGRNQKTTVISSLVERALGGLARSANAQCASTQTDHQQGSIGDEMRRTQRMIDDRFEALKSKRAAAASRKPMMALLDNAPAKQGSESDHRDLHERIRMIERTRAEAEIAKARDALHVEHKKRLRKLASLEREAQRTIAQNRSDFEREIYGVRQQHLQELDAARRLTDVAKRDADLVSRSLDIRDDSLQDAEKKLERRESALEMREAEVDHRVEQLAREAEARIRQNLRRREIAARNLEQDLQEREKRQAALESRVVELQHTIDTMEFSTTEATSKLADSEEKMSSIVAQHKVLVNLNETLSAKLKSTEEERASLLFKVNQSSKELSKCKETLQSDGERHKVIAKTLSSQLDSLRETHSEELAYLRAELKDAQESCAEVSAEMKRRELGLLEEIESLQVEVEEGERSVDGWKRKATEAESYATRTREEMSELKRLLKSARAALAGSGQDASAPEKVASPDRRSEAGADYNERSETLRLLRELTTAQIGLAAFGVRTSPERAAAAVVSAAPSSATPSFSELHVAVPEIIRMPISTPDPIESAGGSEHEHVDTTSHALPDLPAAHASSPPAPHLPSHSSDAFAKVVRVVEEDTVQAQEEMLQVQNVDTQDETEEEIPRILNNDEQDQAEEETPRILNNDAQDQAEEEVPRIQNIDEQNQTEEEIPQVQNDEQDQAEEEIPQVQNDEQDQAGEEIPQVQNDEQDRAEEEFSQDQGEVESDNEPESEYASSFCDDDSEGADEPPLVRTAVAVLDVGKDESDSTGAAQDDDNEEKSVELEESIDEGSEEEAPPGFGTENSTSADADASAVPDTEPSPSSRKDRMRALLQRRAAKTEEGLDGKESTRTNRMKALLQRRADERARIERERKEEEMERERKRNEEEEMERKRIEDERLAKEQAEKEAAEQERLAAERKKKEDQRVLQEYRERVRKKREEQGQEGEQASDNDNSVSSDPKSVESVLSPHSSNNGASSEGNMSVQSFNADDDEEWF